MKEQENNTATPVIEVIDLVRQFGKRRVLNGLSFTVNKGDTMIIMGGSGCGKSTLLRHLIGALRPTSGSIKLFGQETTTMSDDELSGVRRRFGVLFQSGALLQSFTLAENIALPITEHGAQLDANIVELMVKLKLEQVGLSGFENLKPAEISGGMKKRVGLARALALDPELLFSDEPTSGLDPIGANAFDDLILTLQRTLGLTVFMVTHDLDSLHRVCNRIAVLAAGRVVADGPITTMLASDHPWVTHYFRGMRGRVVASAGR